MHSTNTMDTVSAVSAVSAVAAPVAVPVPIGADAVRRYQGAATSAATRRAYYSDWAKFERWCDRVGQQSLPASTQTVLAFLTEHADLRKSDGTNAYSSATIERWSAAVNWVHSDRGLPEPAVGQQARATIRGVRLDRARGADPARRERRRQARPLMLNDLKRVLRRIDVGSYPAGVIGRRDHALLLIGWGGAFRRAELVDLLCRDVTLQGEDGLHITVTAAKNDPEGRGHVKALPFGQNPLTCAPCAYARWRAAVHAHRSGDGDPHRSRVALMRLLRNDPRCDEHVCRSWDWTADAATAAEPVFLAMGKNAALRSSPIAGSIVRTVTLQRARAAGVDATGLSAHSLRAGFVTQADRAGASTSQIAQQTGQSDSTVARYRRHGNPLANNAITRLDL